MTTLNEIDTELFEFALLVGAQPTSKIECPLLCGFKVSVDTYVERYRRWREVAALKNEVRMVGFK